MSWKNLIGFDKTKKNIIFVSEMKEKNQDLGFKCKRKEE